LASNQRDLRSDTDSKAATPASPSWRSRSCSAIGCWHFCCAGFGCAFLERVDAARGVEDTGELERRILSGESLIVFSKRTFRRQPGLTPFHLGALRCAARARLPLVPVALIGTRSLLRELTGGPA